MDTDLLEILGGIMALAAIFALDYYRKYRQKKRADDFKPLYDEFIRKHGELYEVREVQVADSEKEKANRNYVFMIVLISFLGLLFIVVSILKPPDSRMEYLELVFFLVFVTMAIYVFVRMRKSSVGTQTKKIIKGVVTNMLRERARSFEYFVTISGRDKVQVLRREFRKCTFGDIVTMESSASGTYQGNKITVVGRI